jgi:hypothetical protein
MLASFFSRNRHTGYAGLRLVPVQPHEAAALALVGPRLRPRPRNVGEPLLLAQLCAAFRARGSLEIVRDRFSGRPAPQRQT